MHDTALPLPPDIRWMQRATRVLLGLLLLGVIGVLAWRGAQARAFDWRLLVIEGEVQRNSLATLRANVLPHLSGNFLTSSLGEVQRVFEGVPWVRQAEVRRVWPARLSVRLEEHHAVATWDGRGEYGEPPLERALLNSHGEVFSANLGDVEDEELPQLVGPGGSEGQVLKLWRALDEASRAHRLRVLRLALSGRGSWRAVLSNGAQVELGRGAADALLARYREFLPHALAVARRFQTQVLSADLRHPDGYALRLAGIGTKPQNPPVKPPRKT